MKKGRVGTKNAGSFLFKKNMLILDSCLVLASDFKKEI